MIELSYISEADHFFSEKELAELLRSARANNLQNDITGLLLYKAPLFMQVIEGPEPAVLELFEKIKEDARHNNVSGLVKDEISKRTFPDWQMGFVTPETSDVRQMEGFSDFLESSWNIENLKKRPSLSHRMLLSFREQKIREP